MRGLSNHFCLLHVFGTVASGAHAAGAPAAASREALALRVTAHSGLLGAVLHLRPTGVTVCVMVDMQCMGWDCVTYETVSDRYIYICI